MLPLQHLGPVVVNAGSGVTFWQVARPEGFGLGWLGPDWFANLASVAFFLLVAFWFVRRSRA